MKYKRHESRWGLIGVKKSKRWLIVGRRLKISKFRTLRWRHFYGVQISILASWRNVETGETAILSSTSFMHKKKVLKIGDVRKYIAEAIKQMELSGSWVLERILAYYIIRWQKRKRRRGGRR